MAFVSMLISAFAAFLLATRWMERGKSGAALTLISLTGASFVILFYAAQGTLGLDPVQAISWALLFALPATAGACAGTLLGWLIRKRRDKRLP